MHFSNGFAAAAYESSGLKITEQGGLYTVKGSDGGEVFTADNTLDIELFFIAKELQQE